MNRRQFCDGFTMIELMTVVTIISILAAIAIPNFMNAVIRAKVARSQSDQAVVGWALEMYRLDTDEYPPNAEIGQSSPGDLTRLTHPVMYMTSLPQDPFLAPSKRGSKQFVQQHRGGHQSFFYLNILQWQGEPMPLSRIGMQGSTNYVVYGHGPAFELETGFPPDEFTPYSASNGTRSIGILMTTTP